MGDASWPAASSIYRWHASGPATPDPALGRPDQRQFEEVSGKVQRGEYPRDPDALAGRLVEEQILTEFQANAFCGTRSTAWWSAAT